MLRTFIVVFLAGSSDANRIALHEVSKEVAQADFGASCEDLQSMFRNHLIQMAALQAAHQEEHLSTGTQARFSMRALRIVRTLRRARTCSWVTDSDSEDIEQMQAVAQAFISSNPCAPAARAELEAGTNPETEEIGVATVNHAMQILMSEDCEFTPEDPAGSNEPQSEEDLLLELRASEENTENKIDELLQETDSTNGAFIQSDARTVRSFMRRLGVVFLGLLMVLACVTGTAAIVALIAFVATNIYMFALSGHTLLTGGIAGAYAVGYFSAIGGAAGAFIGLPGCASMAYRVLSNSSASA